MISQPSLGKKILALRKVKDMTQEELKEKCHVSVRTIQRIESGIVTPRLSTIKILIGALGEDPDTWRNTGQPPSLHGMFKTIFLLSGDEEQLMKTFQPAWISGVMYLLLFILNVGLTSLPSDHAMHSAMTLIPVNLMLIVSFFVFIRGYLALARLFEIQLLKVSAYLSLLFVSIAWIVDIIEISFVSMSDFSSAISVFTLVLMGTASLLFGKGLVKLQDGMGSIAKIAGRLEIVFGITYLSIIFSFIGLVLLGPILILEIILLAKAEQQAKNGNF